MKSSNCLLLPLAGDKTAGLPFCAANAARRASTMDGASKPADRLMRVVGRSEIVTSLDQEPLIRPPGTFSRSREKEEMVMTHFEMLLPPAGDQTAGLPFCAAKSKDSSTGTSTSTVRPERSEAKSKDSFAKTPIHRPRSRPNHMPLPLAGEAAGRLVRVVLRSCMQKLANQERDPHPLYSPRPAAHPSGRLRRSRPIRSGAVEAFARQREKDPWQCIHDSFGPNEQRANR